uniref:Large ribosomal subunit protein bL36c n=1 Tax=Karenia mikimotoi TaxID=225107 RepID=A0A0U1WPB1_KARMI|nr:ribosomal protein L36 [Karenia mikimotoi]ASF23283.1 ribosomal protein L36 [Karenia mikimotoi]
MNVKVSNSLSSLRKRSRICQIVKRKGRFYLVCKTNPRFKVRQGQAKMKSKH